MKIYKISLHLTQETMDYEIYHETGLETFEAGSMSELYKKVSEKYKMDDLDIVDNTIYWPPTLETYRDGSKSIDSVAGYIEVFELKSFEVDLKDFTDKKKV